MGNGQTKPGLTAQQAAAYRGPISTSGSSASIPVPPPRSEADIALANFKAAQVTPPVRQPPQPAQSPGSASPPQAHPDAVPPPPAMPGRPPNYSAPPGQRNGPSNLGPSASQRPSSSQTARPPTKDSSGRPGSVPGTVGRDPRRDRGSTPGYLARASGTLTGKIEEDDSQDDIGSEAGEDPPRQLVEASSTPRSARRRPSSGGGGVGAVAAARELRELNGMENMGVEYDDLVRGSRPGTHEGHRVHPKDFGSFKLSQANPGFGLGDTHPPEGGRPFSAMSDSSTQSNPRMLFIENDDRSDDGREIVVADLPFDPKWTAHAKSNITGRFSSGTGPDVMELLAMPSEHPPGSTVAGRAETIKAEIEQRQWHLAVRRSVEDVGMAIDSIMRRDTANRNAQAKLTESARAAAVSRKTEAEDLARRHSVAEQNDLERQNLAKKRANNIFSTEKQRITNQFAANEESARLERERIDKAMKKVEDKMSAEQKRLRKESDDRVQQMIDEDRVKLDTKKTELMASMEDTHSQWVKGLKEIEERQVDAMYQVQKAEALVGKRQNELEDSVQDTAAVQARLDGLKAAESEARRRVAEEEVSLDKTVAELDSEASADVKHAEKVRTEVEGALTALRATHEEAAIAAREAAAQVSSQLHKRKEERAGQREELYKKETEATQEGEARVAEMQEARKELSVRVEAKRSEINSQKTRLRQQDKDDDADFAAVEAKVKTLVEAHDEQCAREVSTLREQLRPQREKWEKALGGVKGEVAVRELARAETEVRASERLGIKQAELEEAERRLMVHREALEAEMAEALAEASKGFDADISSIQLKSSEVEAQCSADQKKVEREAASMRELLEAAQTELNRDRGARMREQANMAAGLEHMKGRIPVMENEVKAAEQELATAMVPREVLAEANRAKVAAKRTELEAQLVPKQEALRATLASQKLSLNDRQAQLEERRKGEQGSALKQMQRLEEVKRVSTSIESTLALQAQEIEAERQRRDKELAAQKANIETAVSLIQEDLMAADAAAREELRQERQRLDGLAASRRAYLASARDTFALAEASRQHAGAKRQEKLERLEAEIESARAAMGRTSKMLRDKRDKRVAEAPGLSDSAQEPAVGEIQSLLHKAEILKIELGLVPIELQLPLANLLEQRATLLEEERQEKATAGREASAVRRAELAVSAHDAVATRTLEAMQAQAAVTLDGLRELQARERERASADLQTLLAANLAWSDEATRALEGVRVRANSALKLLRSQEQSMSDNRTDAQVAFAEECRRLADDEEALLKREQEEPGHLVAAVEAEVSRYAEELDAELRQTPEHMAVASMEHQLLASAASLRSHLNAIAAEGARLDELAAALQRELAAGEAQLAEQVSKVEEDIGRAIEALDSRNAERRAVVVQLENKLQDKMHARKSEELETIRKKCLARDAVELPRVQKVSAETKAVKQESNATIAKVSAERADDTELVEAEASKLSAKVAQQEEQVSAVKERFAKQRAEVQAEVASKRSQVEGRRGSRDEQRKILDQAMAEMDAALADMDSAIKAEKEKMVTFASQLRKQAQELLEENTTDDASVKEQLARMAAESQERVAAEARELEERRKEMEAGQLEVKSQLLQAEAARASQRAAAEERLVETRKAHEELVALAATETTALKSKMTAQRKAGELLEESRVKLKSAELQVKRNRNVLELEGSRITDDRGVVEDDMRLELELLEQESAKFEERVTLQAARSLEEAMATVAEMSNEEHEELSTEWAHFEEQTMHERAELDAELREAEEELRHALKAIDRDVITKAKARVEEERWLVEKHLDAERHELLREKQANDKFDADMAGLLGLLEKKRAALEAHQQNVERAEAKAAEEARNQKLAQLEHLMEQERQDLQQREMTEMMEAMRIAEAQRAAELQLQHTLKALETQKLAFEEQAMQKQRAAESLRAERNDRLVTLQRQLDREKTNGGTSRPGTAPFGAETDRPDLGPRLWSAIPSNRFDMNGGTAPLPPPPAMGPSAAMTNNYLPPPSPHGGFDTSSAVGSPDVSRAGAYDDMGPGLAMNGAGADASILSVSEEYSVLKQQMQEEYEAERARMMAELHELAQAET